MLVETNQLGTPQGRNAFSILLFQDLAVIPLLLLLPRNLILKQQTLLLLQLLQLVLNLLAMLPLH